MIKKTQFWKELRNVDARWWKDKISLREILKEVGVKPTN